MNTKVETSPFTFDETAAAKQYAEHGWFHAPGGVSPELMAVLTQLVATTLGTGSGELGDWAYPEKKSQFLLELPDESHLEMIRRSVALTTGMDPDRTVISERHLKVYSSTAPAMPPAHKDRSASRVTVGIGIDIPEESRLVMWPAVDREYNPYPTAAEWRETRHECELPEHLTADIDPIEIDMRRGDVVMFRGAEIYHERHRPASTSVLYLKFNDIGLDPLGEDPNTLRAEDLSARILSNGEAQNPVVRVSPRLVGLRTDELFPNLGTIAYARTIENERAIRLTAREADLLRSVANSGSVAMADIDNSDKIVERLAEFGLVVLS